MGSAREDPSSSVVKTAIGMLGGSTSLRKTLAAPSRNNRLSVRTGYRQHRNSCWSRLAHQCARKLIRKLHFSNRQQLSLSPVPKSCACIDKQEASSLLLANTPANHSFFTPRNRGRILLSISARPRPYEINLHQYARPAVPLRVCRQMSRSLVWGRG